MTGYDKMNAKTPAPAGYTDGRCPAQSSGAGLSALLRAASIPNAKKSGMNFELNKAGMKVNRQKPNQSKCIVLFCNRHKTSKDAYCHRHKRQIEMHSCPVQVYYNKLKLSAKRRGILFTITLQEFKQWAAEVQLIEKKSSDGKKFWHIDRKKNENGYIPGNLQLLNYHENTTKSHLEPSYISSQDPF